MAESLSNVVSNNVIVFTRSLFEDYHYYYKSPSVSESYYYGKNAIVPQIENAISREIMGNVGATDWKQIATPNGIVVLRGVVDGRTDDCGRSIRRIEGALLPRNTQLSLALPLLEQELTQKQIESNNYGYGSLEKFLGDNVSTIKNDVPRTEVQKSEVNIPSSLMNDISNNVIVFTRSLFEDYHYYYKSPSVSESYYYGKNAIVPQIENAISREINGNVGVTDWKQIATPNGIVVLRGVVDGRTDDCGRSIRRIEGALLPRNTQLSLALPLLEQELTQKQIESNNYGYGLLQQFLPRYSDNDRKGRK